MTNNPALLAAAHSVPFPVCEYKFHELRKWRLDYAWPDAKIALEVEGAIWTRGRHTRGAGFLKDIEKYNTLAAMGWLLVRCTPQTEYTQETTYFLRECFKRRNNTL